MTNIAADRRIPGDWHPDPTPPNVFWRDVPANSIAAGNPAAIVRELPT